MPNSNVRTVMSPSDEWIECADIIRQLQNHADSPQSARILRVMKLLAHSPTGTPKDIGRAMTEMRKLLGRYRWIRTVGYSQEGWRAVLSPDRSAQPSPDEQPDEWEYRAVGALLDLTLRPGGLSRLVFCQSCPRLFLAAPLGKIPKFCSSRCKQINYDRKPEQKVLKARQMRAYRERLETMSRNQIEAAGKMWLPKKALDRK